MHRTQFGVSITHNLINCVFFLPSIKLAQTTAFSNMLRHGSSFGLDPLRRTIHLFLKVSENLLELEQELDLPWIVVIALCNLWL